MSNTPYINPCPGSAPPHAAMMATCLCSSRARWPVSGARHGWLGEAVSRALQVALGSSWAHRVAGSSGHVGHACCAGAQQPSSLWSLRLPNRHPAGASLACLFVADNPDNCEDAEFILQASLQGGASQQGTWQGCEQAAVNKDPGSGCMCSVGHMAQAQTK